MVDATGTGGIGFLYWAATGRTLMDDIDDEGKADPKGGGPLDSIDAAHADLTARDPHNQKDKKGSSGF